MTLFRGFRQGVTLAVALIFAVSVVLPQVALAGMVGTEQAIAQEQAQEERAMVAAYMARDEVRQEFAAMGIEPAEAEARVAALSDSEVSRLASHLESEPAGESAVGAIVGAAVFVFLVLLITDIAGFTNVFPFVERR